MDILQGLNEVQKQALLQTKGAVLVTAGAGSGKTKLLTHRIAYLLEHERVNEHNILAITFTNKAANEMKERVSAMLNRANGVWISTFHSMCLKILRRYISRLEGFTTDFSVYSESDAEKTLKQIIKDLNLPNDDFKHYSYVISYCQNENMDIYEYVKRDLSEQQELIKVYETYEQTLIKNNALDFDHLLTKTYELLSCNKDILEYFANRFEYIFVDEFQDTNKVQYDLVKLLSSVHKNIFVVGDEDQCIYTWRGANFQNIFNFKTEFAPVKMFKLEQNYRCTKNILEKANVLIKNNTERFDKILWTNNDEGKTVECYQMYDEQAEAESVASKIIAVKNNGGYDFKDIAILMRMNALSLSFEQKLLNYNIPYRIYGGFKFYERQEIKNLISYLRLFCNPNDDTALLRIINFPKRAIGDAAIEKIRKYAQSKDMSMLSGLMYLYEHSEEDSGLYSKTKQFIQSFISLKQQYSNLKLDATEIHNQLADPDNMALLKDVLTKLG
ncbi:MAG: UvrD-helicase domain-containing protein [Clostridia bacterium]|nr:UvrD-helicase domain-containing protein [Clostridia bacterium]